MRTLLYQPIPRMQEEKSEEEIGVSKRDWFRTKPKVTCVRAAGSIHFAYPIHIGSTSLHGSEPCGTERDSTQGIGEMLQRRNLLGLASLLFLGPALNAQTTVTTSGGTSNAVPVYTGSSTLGNSPISISGNNVGIGTTTPQGSLQVVGTGSGVITLGESDPNSGKQIVLGVTTSGNGSGMIQSVYQGHAYIPLSVNPNGGNVGIGTLTPASNLEIFTPTLDGIDTYSGLLMRSNNYGYLLEGGLKQNAGAVLKFSSNNNGTVDERVRLDPNGNVGIGTTVPGARLEVNGGIKLTSGTGGSLSFSDNTVQSTAWTGVLSGGDYAESVNVSGNRNTYEPGDVLVIDSVSEGNFLKSSTPYATTVTGIYSTKPGVTGRRQHTPSEHMKEEVPMAMTGIVPTKVNAENGPIKPGDLLVTSSKPGYAMKGTDRSQMLGAVIGKAIGHLDAGIGIIEVVVTLQ